MALNEQQDQALNDYINKQLTEITDKKYYEVLANSIKLLCLSAQRFEINVNNTDNGYTQ